MMSDKPPKGTYPDFHVTAQLSKGWKATQTHIGDLSDMFIDWTFPYRMQLADGSFRTFKDYKEMHVYIKSVCLSYQKAHREPVFAK